MKYFFLLLTALPVFAQRQAAQIGTVAEHRIQDGLAAGKSALGQCLLDAGDAGGIERPGWNKAERGHAPL